MKSSTSVSLANWRADRLTATGGTRRPASRQSRICRHAAWITQRPIGTIRPRSSASGMNSIGGTRPRVGCCQRSSASMLDHAAAGDVDLGLEVEQQLAARQRELQRRLELELARRELGQLGGVELDVVLALLLGQVHRRVGVLEQASPSRRRRTGSRAMPMLPVTRKRWPWSVIGSPIAASSLLRDRRQPGGAGFALER